MTPTPDQFSMVVVLVGLTGILSLVSMVVNIWKNLKREPPIDQTLQEYARRADMDHLRCELREECVRRHNTLDTTFQQLFHLIRKGEERNSEWQRSIERQIGRIEAAVKEHRT